jgi:hypothetical protein
MHSDRVTDAGGDRVRACAADAPLPKTLRGKLVVREGKPAVLETADNDNKTK